MQIIPISSGSRRGNCYRIDDRQTSILIDCGVSWEKIQRAFGFLTSRITACLISHEHGDHCHRGTIQHLLKYGIPIMASMGTSRIIGVKPSPSISRWHDWDIQAFPVHHDAIEPWGFLVRNRDQKLLYLTDSPYTDYTFSGLTHIMIEANFAQRIVDTNMRGGSLHPATLSRLQQTHMSIETCRQTLLANDLSRVQEIWLLHLSDTNSDAEDFKRQIQAATGRPVYVA